MNSIPIDLAMLSRRRVRPVLQGEASECGLASLAMILNYWGGAVDLGALRRRFGLSARGIGLRELMQMADTLDLTTRPLRLEIEHLAELRLPAILHWDMNHFVVIERVARGRAYILDPGYGGVWHDAASLSRHFTGIALELRPAATFAPVADRRPLRLRDLWTRIDGLRRSLAQIALLSLVLQAHVLAAPYMLELAIDHALPALDLNLLSVLAIGFGLLALVNGAAALLRAFVLLASGTAVSFGISVNVARRVLRLPVAWFERRSVGDILSRFQSIAPIERFLTETAGAAAIDGLLAGLTMTLMIFYSPLLAAIPLVSLLLYAALRVLSLSAERSAEAERIAAAGREQTTMIESLRGIVTLRLAGRETMRHAVWQNRLSEALGARYAHERIKAWYQTAGTLLATLENVACVWLAVRFAIDGGFSVGMVFAFLAYQSSFSTATRRLVDEIANMRLLRLHLERLSDITHEGEDVGFLEITSAGPASIDRVEFRGVHYAYGEHDLPVLSGVDFAVTAGDHVAITGPSGGGKSTFVKLLLGLLDPDEGAILVNGLPLARYGRRAFRERVGAVLQDDTLFAGSIAENVAGFDEIDEQRLAEALAAAAIADDVAAMPMRHLTPVGDMGAHLSGGQRQRVLLARALYRRPQILVMDEGTAHLDTEHEAEVNRAIAAMAITRIIIAHRKETIAAADRVVELKSGVLLPR